MNEENLMCPICGGLHPVGHQDKELGEQLKTIREWYEQNKEEAIPYQRRPTKWDRLGWILQSSTPTARETK